MGSLFFLKHKSDLFICLLFTTYFLLLRSHVFLQEVLLFQFDCTSICGFKKQFVRFLQIYIKPRKISVILWQITII
jgi:hypothetical protein